MLNKIWEKKGVRFLIAGGTNTLIDLTILNILVLVVGLPTVIGNLISASISITVSYYLNHRFVFRSIEPHTLRRFVRFFIVTGIGILVIQTIVITVMSHLLGHREIGVNHLLHPILKHPLKTSFINLNIAKLTAVIVAMGWNFTLYHFVIFKKHDTLDTHADAASVA